MDATDFYAIAGVHCILGSQISATENKLELGTHGSNSGKESAKN